MKKKLLVFGSKATTCKNCRKVEALVDEIITGREDEFDRQFLPLDSDEAFEHGVLTTPCVVLNGIILIMGECPNSEDLKEAILNFKE